MLFIHGIGQRTKGETLVNWLDPMVRWITAWLEQCPRQGHPSTISVGESAADANKEGFNQEPACSVGTAMLVEEDAPVHVRVGIRRVTPETGIQQLSSILVAEAFWAASYPRANAQEVTDWLLIFAPSTVLAHFGNRLRRACRRYTHSAGAKAKGMAAIQVVWALLQLGLTVPILPILVAVLLSLALLRLLPFSSLADALLQRVQVVLATVIGDSMIFCSSPARLSAIITDVRKAIEWMEPRCRRMVIVAHSQGAAVLRHSIDEPHLLPPANLAGIVTFGAGLHKLEALLGVERLWGSGDNGDGVRFSYLMIAHYLRAAAFVIAIAVVGRLWGVWEFPMFLAGFFSLMLFVILVLHAWFLGEPTTDLECWWEQIKRRRPGAEWLDLYGSADPVSNGPLWMRPPTSAWSVSVANRASMLMDHTSYWGNYEGFVSRVLGFVSRIGCLAIPLHKISPKDEVLIERAAARRARRASLLTLCRWSLGFAAAALFAVQGPSAIGELFRDNVTRHAMVGMPIAVRLLAGHLLSINSALLGLLAVVGSLGLIYQVTLWIWEVWCAASEANFFAREDGNVNYNAVLSILSIAPAALATALIAELFWPKSDLATSFVCLGWLIVSLWFVFSRELKMEFSGNCIEVSVNTARGEFWGANANPRAFAVLQDGEICEAPLDSTRRSAIILLPREAELRTVIKIGVMVRLDSLCLDQITACMINSVGSKRPVRLLAPIGNRVSQGPQDFLEQFWLVGLQ
jgi:hypothetical protein